MERARAREKNHVQDKAEREIQRGGETQQRERMGEKEHKEKEKVERKHRARGILNLSQDKCVNKNFFVLDLAKN